VALGARNADLQRMVLMQCAQLVVPGTIVGIVLALTLGRVVRSLIYDVSPADPLIYSVVVVLMLLVALLAALVPARRAAHADPMVMLRAE
jgi:ABC-type antimicrobial peptide transport system permease subunit